MPRPIRKSLSALGSTTPIAVDIYQPTHISVSVKLSAGAVLTYSVQHTYDDPFASTFDPATAVWFNNADLNADTTNGESNYMVPVTALRLAITSYTSGTATITVLQTGNLP